MKIRGRPKQATPPRESKLIVRLTDDERKKVNSECSRARITASDYVRKMLGFPPVKAS